jgi:GDP-4-dehydro-6-deoxy-D-mannose reductase
VRALVTGGNGFVGRHLVAALRARGDEVLIAGRASDPGELDLPLDLSDLSNLRAVVEIAQPETIFHLAAQAFVPDANRDPLGTYDTNALGTARLFEAARLPAVAPRIVFVSSAEVYGARARSDYPLVESLPVSPATPYAASKAAGEAFALAAYRTYGIPAIVARSFNHIGPGQDPRFAVPSFARQLAAIAAGAEPVLHVGNLKALRDVLDVRDVVAAYIALAEHGEPGTCYNVCSGNPVEIEEVLRRLISIAHIAVEVREDPGRMRPSDVPLFYGDNARLRAATGWAQRVSLGESLRDVFADAQARLPVALRAPDAAR